MRPTVRDLARAAGVSLATVDRVLNARAGVRPRTVEQVTRAIERIGFERNAAAAALARRRPWRFLFVLPAAGDQFVAGLVGRIADARRAFASDMVEVETTEVDGGDPHGIAARLGALAPGDWSGVAIMAPETPPVRDAIDRLTGRGIHAVALVSQQPGAAAAAFVGVDNVAAGATAGELLGRFVGPRPGAVLVVGDSLKSRDSAERRLGFDRVLARAAPALRVLPSVETHGDERRTRAAVASVLAARPDLVGAYAIGLEARVPLTALAEAADAPPLVRIAHERTPFTESALREGRVDALVTQDQGHLVRSAVRLLRARCEGRETLAAQERIRIEILLRHNL